jgi:hypothetical protein
MRNDAKDTHIEIVQEIRPSVAQALLPVRFLQLWQERQPVRGVHRTANQNRTGRVPVLQKTSQIVIR